MRPPMVAKTEQGFFNIRNNIENFFKKFKVLRFEVQGDATQF